MCRRWYECVHSGPLCQHAWAGGSSWQAFSSLACWLQRHHQHVRSLRLTVGQAGGWDRDEPHQLMLLGCCLATAAATGQLERLHLSSQAGLLVPAAWMQPLRRLRELTLLGPRSRVVIGTSLEHHTQLTALCLGASAVVYSDGARLPHSLLRLELTCCNSYVLPTQVRCVQH